jgi:hypothetical protein
VSGECESHSEEESKDKAKRQVTALSDKSESAMRTAAVQRHCGSLGVETALNVRRNFIC